MLNTFLFSLLITPNHAFSATVSKEFLQAWSPPTIPTISHGYPRRVPSFGAATSAPAARSASFNMKMMNCSQNVCFHGLCSVSLIEECDDGHMNHSECVFCESLQSWGYDASSYPSTSVCLSPTVSSLIVSLSFSPFLIHCSHRLFPSLFLSLSVLLIGLLFFTLLTLFY